VQLVVYSFLVEVVRESEGKKEGKEGSAKAESSGLS
jgi:hypothetical protein